MRTINLQKSPIICADSLSPFSHLLFYIYFFTKTFFGNLKMDIYNVQISKMENDVQILKTMRP